MARVGHPVAGAIGYSMTGGECFPGGGMAWGRGGRTIYPAFLQKERGSCQQRTKDRVCEKKQRKVHMVDRGKTRDKHSFKEGGGMAGLQ